MDAISDKQYKLLQYGGNKKFKEFMEKYDLNSQPSKIKYRTKAADYYRQQVTSIDLFYIVKSYC